MNRGNSFFNNDLLFLLFLTINLYASTKDETIAWTDEELKFMEEHPIIELGVAAMISTRLMSASDLIKTAEPRVI